MIDVIARFFFFCIGLSTWCFADEGRAIFVKNCLNCHSENGVAQKLNFSSQNRIAEIKDILIEKVKNQQMPPLQYRTEPSFLKISGDVAPFNEVDRKKLLDWFQNLTVAENDTSFTKEASRITLFKKDKPIDPQYVDAVLTFTKKNLDLVYQKFSGTDVYQVFKIKVSESFLQSKPASFLGFEITPNSLMHHSEVNFGKPGNLEMLFLWTPFHAWVSAVPGKLRVKLKNLSELYFNEHLYFGDDIRSPLDNDFRVKIFFSNSPPNAIPIKIMALKLQMAFLSSEGLKLTYKSQGDYDLRMISPHMHARGRSMNLQLYRPLYRELVNVAEFYGWTHHIQSRFLLQTPYRVHLGDTVIVKCQYAETDGFVSLGWGTKDEMCVVTLHVSEVE